ncbi:MAG: hypothetical protein IPG45_05990 [Deltaproteobacteria bacterium]|nr:hypothetical protein [Deltaproteobacteria bacterium]
MPIGTPQIAALLGALDSDAVAAGEPFSAHWKRALARSTNRMLAKPQQLFNLSWPERTYGEDSLYPFEGVGALEWNRILPPIPVDARPGFTAADFWLRMSVASGLSLEVYVATSQRPWRPGITPDATILGTGSFANTDLTGLAIAESGAEDVELWVRGVASATLATTATYGAPNTRSAVGGSYLFTAGGSTLNLSAATWNLNTSANNLASGGHYVRFEDASGEPALPSRTIVSVPTATTLVIAPPLTERQATIAVELDRFSIYRLPVYILSGFGAVTVARTT